MARLARVVVPGIPHHVTQRGNRRQATFFGDDDYAAYLGEFRVDGSPGPMRVS
jgi:putative transposase